MKKQSIDSKLKQRVDANGWISMSFGGYLKRNHQFQVYVDTQPGGGRPVTNHHYIAYMNNEGEWHEAHPPFRRLRGVTHYKELDKPIQS